MSRRTPPETDLGLLRQLWRFRAYGRREIAPLLLGVGMRVGELICDLATPWPLALVIDHTLRGTPLTGPLATVGYLLGPSPVGMLTVAAVAVLLITAASGAFDYVGDRIMNGAGERITSRIRSDMFTHLLKLPMPFHDRKAVGEVTSRIATDTSRIEDGMVDLFSTLVPGLLALVGYGAVLLSVNWRLGLIALCAAPLLFFTAARYTKLTRGASRRRRAAEGKQSALVAESLHGIRTIHAFGRQDLHNQRFARANDLLVSVRGGGHNVTGNAVTARLAACERCCDIFNRPAINAVIASPPPMPRNPDDQPATAPIAASEAQCRRVSSGTSAVPFGLGRGGRNTTIVRRIVR